MKIFISMPMNGRTDEEIQKDFEQVQAIVRERYQDAEFVDTYIKEDAPADSNAGLWYMSKSLEIMSKCDLVVFPHDYQKSRGCEMEELLAGRYELERLYL